VIGRGVRLGTVFGIPIRLDYSWGIIALLLTAGMAVSLAQSHPYLGLGARVFLGLSASVLLFASVLAHELSHAVVALRHGVGIRSITLFVFGGAAEMMKEPPSADSELKIAAAGPLMSLALGAAFGGFYWLGTGVLPPPFNTILLRLTIWNVVLVAFNIVPGFPLDGGRVLRAALWGIWGTLPAATRVASGVGSFFGGLVMFFGMVWILFSDNLIGGLWFIFIGLFLRYAARASYKQLLVREALEGIRAKDLMTVIRDGDSVSPGMSLAAVVDEVVLPRGVKEVPVVDGGVFIGMLSLQSLEGPWVADMERLTVGDVMPRVVESREVSPDESAADVLSRFGAENRRLPVVRDGVLVGVLSRDDALRRLSLALEHRH